MFSLSPSVNRFVRWKFFELHNIQNDLNMAKGSVSPPPLGSLFNTFEHNILLGRLNAYYGISELTLGWFKSYLSERTHPVKVGGTLSHPAVLQFGVRQSCVQFLFLTILNPISSFIHSHCSINYHFYADDTKLCITLSQAIFCHSIQTLNNWPNDIQNFMLTNKLKLNPDKTEFVLVGSKNNCKQLLPPFLINIIANHVSPAQIVKNLRVVFRVHATDLYRNCLPLELKTSVLFANALVGSRLDYCNSLFVSLTDFELRRLQWVQNSLCKVVT